MGSVAYERAMSLYDEYAKFYNANQKPHKKPHKNITYSKTKYEQRKIMLGKSI